MATVRIEPANPATTKLVKPASDGKTVTSQGIKYVAVTCAMMPATKPNRAIKPNIFNLPFIQFTTC